MEEKKKSYLDHKIPCHYLPWVWSYFLLAHEYFSKVASLILFLIYLFRNVFHYPVLFLTLAGIHIARNSQTHPRLSTHKGRDTLRFLHNYAVGRSRPLCADLKLCLFFFLPHAILCHIRAGMKNSWAYLTVSLSKLLLCKFCSDYLWTSKARVKAETILDLFVHVQFHF